MKSSIYHFFAELLTYRGHLTQQKNLEAYEKFPDSLIAARSFKSGSFPDLVLRYDSNEDPSGGELIELKTSKQFTIPSFNSTPPSAQKRMASLSKTLRKRLRDNGESFEINDLRDVYYLLVGRKDAKPAPLTKVCLVHGSFFETLPLRDVLIRAGTEVLGRTSGSMKIDLQDIFKDESAEEIKARFAETRTVIGSGTKVRFRVMFEASEDADLMKETRFPLIVSDSISFLTKLDIQQNDAEFPLMDWDADNNEIRNLRPYMHLANALDDVDPTLKGTLRIGTMRHPLNELYFVAQASLT